MPCDLRVDEHGATFVCTRGRPRRRPCVTCGALADRLCDGLLGGVVFGRAPRTCDAPICEAHRTSIGPDRDLCPLHAEARTMVAL